jgi:hypothetical protein
MNDPVKNQEKEDEREICQHGTCSTSGDMICLEIQEAISRPTAAQSLAKDNAQHQVKKQPFFTARETETISVCEFARTYLWHKRRRRSGWLSSVPKQQANALQKLLVGSKSSVETGAKEEMHQRSSAQRTLEEKRHNVGGLSWHTMLELRAKEVLDEKKTQKACRVTKTEGKAHKRLE